MNIHFLGTSAAEGFPGVFCRCEHCARARKLGGKNIRTRTSVLIDGVLKIDMPPDTYHHVLRDSLDLGAVKDLFITHTHSDHLYVDELFMRAPGFQHGCEHPLMIYGHDAAIQLCRQRLGSNETYFKLNRIQPFETVEAETARITPLPAEHSKDETCLLYFIERNGKSILYGHDTGWFLDSTWEWLENQKLDLAILDCTNGNIPSRKGHMNIEAVVEIDQRFKSLGVYHKNSQTIATHFSHNTGLQHEDLVRIFTPHGIEVAYDGMNYIL